MLHWTIAIAAASKKENTMKRISTILAIFTVFFIATAAMAYDKATISQNVDSIVAGIDGGKDILSLKATAFDPYAFVMQEDGILLVHPTLSGKSLKEEAPPVYEALMKAKPEGVWIQYEWNGKIKNTYAKKTSTNLIVGSGY
jgi:hypothetical protein